MLGQHVIVKLLLIIEECSTCGMAEMIMYGNSASTDIAVIGTLGLVVAALVYHFFFAFVSDTKALTQRRGLAEKSSAGRTATPATEDPMGTPEIGSTSTSIATCTLETYYLLRRINDCGYKEDPLVSIKTSLFSSLECSDYGALNSNARLLISNRDKLKKLLQDLFKDTSGDLRSTIALSETDLTAAATTLKHCPLSIKAC
jgi:hypothetical protein